MKASWVIFLDSKREEILIIKRAPIMRNPGQWCFPGGSSGKHKPKKLAKKEALEEVGIKVNKIKMILKVPTKYKKYFFYVLFVDKDKLDISLNEESVKHKWVKLYKVDNHKKKHRSIRIFIKYHLHGKENKRRPDIRVKQITKQGFHRSSKRQNSRA